MKVTINTTLITMSVEDNPSIIDGYTKRTLPELPISIKSIIDEAIRLHNSVANSTPKPADKETNTSSD